MKKVTIKFITEAASRVLELETGAVDIAYNIDGLDTERVKQIPGYHVETGESVRYFLICLSMQEPLFQNKDVRYAMSYAIDKKALVSSCTDGYGTPISTMVPPLVLEGSKVEPEIPYDVAKAKELMISAGYPDGFTIDLHVEAIPIMQRLAEAIQGMWAEIGIKLIPSPPGKIIGGKILFQGEDLINKSEAEMRTIRGKKISMIFQDPMTALNPVRTVGDQIAEVIRLHQKISKAQSLVKAQEMMELVGIEGARHVEYPSQFSGGMKQRIVIAIALACNPLLLIADEPTTALDVTIQAQVMDLIDRLKTEFKTSLLLITHDLGLVVETCSKVAIIYAGKIVEFGTIEHIFNDTKHPYTIGLFGSIPNFEENVRRLRPISGLMPDPNNLPKGCSFAERCTEVTDKCRCGEIPVTEVTDKCRCGEIPVTEVKSGHFVKCIKFCQ